LQGSLLTTGQYDLLVLVKDATNTWLVGSSARSPATPTASAGLTAIAGTAVTYTRSDGAPALDQTIIPTWTGIHTFNQAANAALLSQRLSPTVDLVIPAGYSSIVADSFTIASGHTLTIGSGSVFMIL